MGQKASIQISGIFGRDWECEQKAAFALYNNHVHNLDVYVSGKSRCLYMF